MPLPFPLAFPATTSAVWKNDADNLLYGRIRGTTGVLTSADVSSIAYAVRDLTDGATDATGTFTVSTVMFDSLQQDDENWTQDDADNVGIDGEYGYNFRATLAKSLGLFSDIDIDSDTKEVTPHEFQVDVQWTLTNGEILHHAWKGFQLVTYNS